MKEQKPKEEVEKQEDHLEQLQRLQAEFENYQKRVEKEQGEKAKYASTDLLKKLLTLTDTFEQALKSMQKEDEHTKGVEMMYQTLQTILKEEGVKAMEVEGKQLNPEEHEVLAKVEGGEEGVIIEEVQKGYFYKDKILRHAKVKISSGKA
tara:strand:- start:9626 stop:10075 length:450 start_codon:yes stop_codon:yes gene_type:complete